MSKLSINTTLDYSPNFDEIKRAPKQIKSSGIANHSDTFLRRAWVRAADHKFHSSGCFKL